jgi:mannose-1-phosphate guanylyltransferase
MKAVVLAGGFATRLRPISYVVPKLLFPVAGKPMIYWTLDLLKRFQVDEVVLGVNYLADVLRRAVGDEYHGMRIKYSLESHPLGTAGPIKLASRLVRLTKAFIAMNGDVIADINLGEMLRRHESSQARVTDALHEVDDPSRFGVVEIDSSSRIVRFVEKPRLRDAPSRLVNAGVYVIDRSVVEMIPPGRKVSLEREIFPVLARRGELSGFLHSDYWFDIGSLSEYRNANFALLRRLADGSVVRGGRRSVQKHLGLIPPSIIGKESSIGRMARLGPSVLVGNNVRIGPRSKVSYSILFDGVDIGGQTTIAGTIVGSDSSIGERVRIESGAIISPNVTVRDGVRIGKGAIVHPYTEITKNIKPLAQVM